SSFQSLVPSFRPFSFKLGFLARLSPLGTLAHLQPFRVPTLHFLQPATTHTCQRYTPREPTRRMPHQPIPANFREELKGRYRQSPDPPCRRCARADPIHI